MLCHVLQLHYISFVHMLFYMDHKVACEYIILFIETKKPQSAHKHFCDTHILYLFLFSLTLFIFAKPIVYPRFVLLPFFLSYDSCLYVTYSDEVTRLMRPVRCVEKRYCA